MKLKKDKTDKKKLETAGKKNKEFKKLSAKEKDELLEKLCKIQGLI